MRIRAPAAAPLLDLPQDVVGAVARLGHQRIEERVHRGEPVGELVDDRHHAQLAALAELDQPRGDVGLQQEVGVLLAAVVVHAAAAVALALVEAVERVMLGVELELAVARLELLVARDGAALRARGLELGGDHAHRHARVAVVAVGTVGEGTTAAKSRRDERAVGVGVDEIAGRGHLRARKLARQVAAGIGSRRVELQVRDRKVVELRHSVPGQAQLAPDGGYCIDSCSSCANALRVISRAPSEARCAVACWQSITRKSFSRSRSTSLASATLEASGARVNIDSPKKTAPSATP